MAHQAKAIAKGPLFVQHDESAWQAVAAQEDAQDVLDRGLRVRGHLLEFVRDAQVVPTLQRALEKASTDGRTRLERLLDGMRSAFVDSRPFPRAKNPTLSLEEAQGMVEWIRTLELRSKLRATLYLTHTSTIAYEASQRRDIQNLLKSLYQEASRPPDADARVLANEVEAEREFFSSFEQARDPHSDGGVALSLREVDALLRLLSRMNEQRAPIFLDALAAMMLTPFSYQPAAASPCATAEAQQVVARAFWAQETNVQSLTAVVH